MRHQEFDDKVKSVLAEVAHQLEVAEAQRYLEEDIREMEERNSNFGNIQLDGFYNQTQTFSFQNGTFSFSQTIQTPSQSPNSSSQSQSVQTTPPTMPSLQVPRSQSDSKNELSERSRALQQRQLEHYLANKSLVDEVIYNMLNSSNSRPLSQRIDNTVLANELTYRLTNNGIEIPFHYVFTTNRGRVIYACCKDVDPNTVENSYSQPVFKSDNPNNTGVIRVYFPTLDDYIDKSVDFMIPSLIFIAILMITFAFTLFVIMRQRKVTDKLQLKQENYGVQCALDDFFELGLSGIVIFIDGELKGYMYGSPLSSDCFDTISGKGSSDVYV